ncbi:MAG: hypothetical protein Q4A32_10465 [Lachnospiraceae bacterium]|nr:hypothetical protein [Lachnospiraceae bacterium]
MDNSVIKRLAEIDLAARSIIEKAEEEKKELAESSRARIEAFDREADSEAARKLDEIRNGLERENAEAIRKLETDMETTLAYIEKNYADRLDACADEIVENILKA